ncbi:MAG: PIN domain-containing protein [Lachnospiraceae bacterium]|nr:PIN domain-containing protein [Lachnospiraceae bacterium]
MSVYLIDYENVNFTGLEGVGTLTPADEVILFYSNAASTIPMNLHIDVQKSGARMQYIRIERTGKNYLDFQLAALSGYLVGTTDQTDFVVISRDTGYDSVLDLWNKQDFVGRTLTFRRQDSIGGNIPVKPRKKRAKKAEDKGQQKKAEKSADQSQSKAPGKPLEKPQSKPAAKSGKKTGGRKRAAEKPAVPARTLSEGKQAEAAKIVKAPVQTAAREPLSNAEKKDIRTAVKELKLKPTDYTKIYRTFEKVRDKQTYNNTLVKVFKNQELGNRIYKATLPVFTGRNI